MLDQFFPAEMDRQTLVPHAREALAALAGTADIVILTNLGETCRQPRIEQLAKFGIEHRVECNQGGKGRDQDGGDDPLCHGGTFSGSSGLCGVLGQKEGLRASPPRAFSPASV